MLFVPPRHGKSELATVRYPIYRLSLDPTIRVIVAAYNSEIAERFSRKSRRIARDIRLPISDERKAVGDWETTVGGGYRAVGVGGGVTSLGGDLIVIDDPIKSREEAESPAYQERVYEWYKDDLYTRLEPDGAMLLINTRWHEKDLAGQILASEDGPNWTVVNLPALAEENDPLDRPLGAALCPERYDETALASIKQVLGERSFHALYQGSPRPREGALFKRHWFEIVEAAPARAHKVRFWDLAATEGGGDWTVGVRISKASDGMYYIEHVERGQWSPGPRDNTILSVAKTDGRAVHIRLEEEGGSAGKSQSLALIKMLAGFAVKAIRPTGSKEIRAMAMASQAEVGNIKIVKGPWNEAFLSELVSFPTGAHDDQVDAASGAFNALAAFFLVQIS